MIKRIYLDTPILKTGETLFETVKKYPYYLEYLLMEHHGICIYKEDIWRMQDDIPEIRLSEQANYNQSLKEDAHKNGLSFTLRILKFKPELSFKPDSSQIIYVEGEYEPTLNNFIQKKQNVISSILKSKNKTLVYIPDSVKAIQDNYSYYSPTQKEVSNKVITSSSIANQIFSYSVDNIDIKAGLLRYKKTDEDGNYLFSYYTFDKLDDTQILKYFEWYSLAVGIARGIHWYIPRANTSSDILYGAPAKPLDYIPSSIDTEGNPDDNADYEFDYESKKLIEEIKERIDALKQKGINEMILKSIFSFDTIEPSRLVINNEYKIFLPDYNNLEITMYPLPKAVFFLFLNHQEGILFKNLPDYRDELIAIYKKVSGRENIDDMEKSINDVVNPTLNSINEKCSRIREAFVKHFKESIAQNYFITGSRATPKKIGLNRDLVILEGVEIKVKVKKTPFEYIKYPSRQYREEDDDLPF